MPVPTGTYWLIKSGDALVGGLFVMAGAEFKDVPANGDSLQIR